MKKLLLTAALILINQSVICQELATTESGKTVQLFKNGTTITTFSIIGEFIRIVSI